MGETTIIRKSNSVTTRSNYAAQNVNQTGSEETVTKPKVGIN